MGLPGPRGDQGSPGVRGKQGPPGPPGLGGCPLPSDEELSRHVREVGHIISTISEMYNSLGLENQMSADEFYDYVIHKRSIGKDTISDHNDDRVARSTNSSTNFNGIPAIPGPVGDQGVPGRPGVFGTIGESGIPGILHMHTCICG